MRLSEQLIFHERSESVLVSEQIGCSLEQVRLSELRSLKRTDLGSGASFLVLACHFLHKLGRFRHVKHKWHKFNQLVAFP